jgi:hypothetical protein
VIALKGIGVVDHPLDGHREGAGKESDAKQAG